MNGLVTMTPSSASGLISTSPDVDAGDDVTQPSFVKVNDNGGVDFQNVVSLSLNDVFTSDFDNYVIYGQFEASQYERLFMQLADATGTPAPDANAYTFQRLRVIDQDVRGNRGTTEWRVANAKYGSFELHVYGPALPFATAARTVGYNEDSVSQTPAFYDFALTHSEDKSYVSCIFGDIGNGVTFTGNLIVMGYAE